jgi:hypothetical protein
MNSMSDISFTSGNALARELSLDTVGDTSNSSTYGH